MRYAYHFEFCERPEMPEWLRGDLFLSLAWLQSGLGLRKILETNVPRIIARSKVTKVIELGSGSGDGLALVARNLPGKIRCTATDLFPHPDLWRKKFADLSCLSWVDTPVSFENFAHDLDPSLLSNSLVLMTSAFHHLPNSKAQAFLARCAEAGAHVLIVEPLMRSGYGAVLGSLSGLPALLSPLACSRVSWGRRARLALFHWAVPLIPFFLSHDGFVSALRQRTGQDWRKLTKGLPFELEMHENLGVLRNFSAVLLRRVDGSAPGALEPNRSGDEMNRAED